MTLTAVDIPFEGTITAADGWRLLDDVQLLELPDPEFLIEGILQRRGVGVLYAPSGAGKTTLVASLAVSLATARDWFGHKVCHPGGRFTSPRRIRAATRCGSGRRRSLNDCPSTNRSAPTPSRMRIVQQLLTPGAKPVFGPTKTGRPRTVAISAESVALLKAHKQHQAEVKMKNRTVYHDFGLVFAKEWGDVRKRDDCLGQPLQANNLGQREYAKLIKVAKVRAIKFHGLRHTCATLLLQAGQPVHVVSERLGHSKVSMTMEVYAHVLPDMQETAAAKLGALLHAF